MRPLTKPGTITLPFPPSYNSYWRNGVISKEGLAFKDRATDALLRVRFQKLLGKVAVHLEVYFPDGKGDLDNRLKQVLDALQGKCYDNDSQIVKIVATRHEDALLPRVEVRVEAVPP